MVIISKKINKWYEQIKRFFHKAIYKSFISKSDTFCWSPLTECMIMTGEYLDTKEANKITLRQLLECYEREISSKKEPYKMNIPCKNIWQLKFNIGNNYAQSYLLQMEL